MKYIYIIFIKLVLISSVYAQLSPSKYEYYSVDNNTERIVFLVGEPTNKISLPAKVVIRIKLVESERIYFKITRNAGSLDANDLYYVSPSEFSEKYFSLRASFKGGFLTVPFKYRPDK